MHKFLHKLQYNKVMDLLAKIKANGFLRFGTTGDYFPVSFVDLNSGKFAGIDIELAEKICDSIGVKAIFVKTGWPCLEQDLLNRKFDLAIGGITITAARKKNFAMSIGYRKTGKTILCRKDDEKKFSQLEEINKPEVKVMYNPGGTNEKFVMEKLDKAQKIMHLVNDEIPGLVGEGKADVMITETLEAEYYTGANKKLAAPLLCEPFTQDEFGVMAAKENGALLEIVNSIIQL